MIRIHKLQVNNAYPSRELDANSDDVLPREESAWASKKLIGTRQILLRHSPSQAISGSHGSFQPVFREHEANENRRQDNQRGQSPGGHSFRGWIGHQAKTT